MSRQITQLSPTCTQIRPATADGFRRRDSLLREEDTSLHSQFPNLPGFRRNITTAPQSPKVCRTY